jgi:hypothetical protein
MGVTIRSFDTKLEAIETSWANIFKNNKFKTASFRTLEVCNFIVITSNNMALKGQFAQF